jgi:hypothetical protein
VNYVSEAIAPDEFGLVRALRRGGTLRQVEWIENASQLRAGVAADRFVGSFLAPEARAGADVDISPRAFSNLLGGHSNVVPLTA